MKCLIHTMAKEPGKEVKISDQNWYTLVNCARKWIVLDGDRRDLAEQCKDVLEGNEDDAASCIVKSLMCQICVVAQGVIITLSELLDIDEDSSLSDDDK